MLLHLPPTLAAMAVAGFGWAYWFATFALYWNFISYALLIGPIVTLPPILYAYLKAPATSSTRSWLLTRRVELSGWLIAALMLALFSNLTVFPGQLQRHLSKSESLITPNDELVQQFKADFLAANPSYHTKDFVTRMQLVDNWVKDKVTWKSDMSQYGVVGLLTTPHEVLERHAGDCQGQSAVTASLLFALGGVQAWCTETPFHWWTHARDDVTRETYNLNAHGHAGLLGSVLPQPVDMVRRVGSASANMLAYALPPSSSSFPPRHSNSRGTQPTVMLVSTTAPASLPTTNTSSPMSPHHGAHSPLPL